jgi:hypothetical protein
MFHLLGPKLTFCGVISSRLAKPIKFNPTAQVMPTTCFWPLDFTIFNCAIKNIHCQHWSLFGGNFEAYWQFRLQVF